ncbi:hypothetical protein BCR32DRAFT_251402 [Anaeromyces robustus]|uniref:CCHC-type domain-containing protein n=1 Tax=Anaeromyces robustus TaxID=1754192 RepID=A0A1Y1VRC3_9FUNG|nr:hypothetical protein BCR32DRAFT_251402 [Anaeromyces robustus]|eukprot:ORX63851.1 hypothetical protein BCR32DRAFT_251402 [Anaeromyces robustus]
MSNKEGNGTKDLLDGFNFKTWKQQLYLLLKEEDLTQFIYDKKLKKISKDNIAEDDLKKHIPVDGINNLFYEKSVTKDMVKKDAKTKKILMNSIKNDLAVNIDFISSTAYEIYNLIKGINLSDDNDRIEEIKNYLNSMRFNENQDIPLSIFISNMNMKFNELEQLKSPLKDSEKFDYLYNSIPEELAIKTNIIDHQENWEETTNYLIKTHQQLKRLKEKKLKQLDVESNSVNVSSNKKYSNYNSNYNNNYNNYNNNYKNTKFNKFNNNNNKYKNKNNYNKNNHDNNNKIIKCKNCGKLGHTIYTCRFKNYKKNNKNFKQNNGRQENK